ncbi:MAG: hypothetical protein RLZZ584_132 [Pseudomonadota bacterium]
MRGGHTRRPAAGSGVGPAAWRRWLPGALLAALLVQLWALPASWVQRLPHFHRAAAVFAVPHAGRALPSMHDEAPVAVARVAPPRRSLFEHKRQDEAAAAPLLQWPSVAPRGPAAPNHGHGHAHVHGHDHAHAALAHHLHAPDAADVVHVDGDRLLPPGKAAPAGTQRALNDAEALPPAPARLEPAPPATPWSTAAAQAYRSHVSAPVPPPPRTLAA